MKVFMPFTCEPNGSVMSEHSDFPYHPNQFLALESFVVSYSITALVREIKHKRAIGQNNKPAKGLHMRQTQDYVLAKHSLLQLHLMNLMYTISVVNN